MDNNTDPCHLHRREIAKVWEEHSSAAWPKTLGASEGQFMMLDTVIAGCANYFLESPDGLDPQRVEILLETQSELQALLPELPEESLEYVCRLKTLCALLLEDPSSG